jgi:hypothetical protein
LIERNARQARHDCAPFMLDGEVGGENEQAQPRPAGDAAIGFKGQVLDQDHVRLRISGRAPLHS